MPPTHTHTQRCLWNLQFTCHQRFPITALCSGGGKLSCSAASGGLAEWKQETAVVGFPSQRQTLLKKSVDSFVDSLEFLFWMVAVELKYDGGMGKNIYSGKALCHEITWLLWFMYLLLGTKQMHLLLWHFWRLWIRIKRNFVCPEVLLFVRDLIILSYD
jgi:hypothetical protein